MSNSRLSYHSEFELMKKALAEDKGIRAPIGSREATMLYRLKLNKARALDRKLNKDIYEVGHILHGGSEFDELVFTVREDESGEWWVYLEKAMVPTHVEAIE